MWKLKRLYSRIRRGMTRKDAQRWEPLRHGHGTGTRWPDYDISRSTHEKWDECGVDLGAVRERFEMHSD